MAWHQAGDKPISEPMIIIVLTHICVTRPPWVCSTIKFICSTIWSSGDICDLYAYALCTVSKSQDAINFVDQNDQICAFGGITNCSSTARLWILSASLLHGGVWQTCQSQSDKLSFGLSTSHARLYLCFHNVCYQLSSITAEIWTMIYHHRLTHWPLWDFLEIFDKQFSH